MFKDRSVLTFVGLAIAVAYLLYIVSYFASINASASNTSEALGAGIATALVMPSIVVLAVGVILGLVGFFNRVLGLQLTAAILYAVAAVIFFPYFFFLVPSIVLGFVGWNQQKKINLAGK